jgi:hypothetical protein
MNMIPDRCLHSCLGRRSLLFLVALVLFVAGACNNSDDDNSTGTCDSNAAIEIKPVSISECDGLGPGSEDCHLRVMWDAAECCPEQPCDRLVVYWAGGNQSCDDVDADNVGAFDPLLGHFVERGFVAACAQPFTTDEEGGAYPYHMEWDRMHHLMQRLRSETSEIWDGSHLLISGASHGGTAPMVVIAGHRALRDYASVWTGSTHTAVIMFDGISNPRTLEEWAGEQALGSNCGLFHSRWVGRYGDGAPLDHSCSNDTCYCSDPDHAADWALDTVIPGAVDPTGLYTCDDFIQESGTTLYRFVSCSGNPGSLACGALGGDIVPDEQQSELFDALKTCDGVTASYARYDCPHILCGGFGTDTNFGGADALDWLVENGW